MTDLSTIGRGTTIRGNVRGDGDLDVHGHVEGSIAVRGELSIGETALIKSDVSGRSVTVRGAVAGNITAEESLVLEAGSAGRRRSLGAAHRHPSRRLAPRQRLHRRRGRSGIASGEGLGVAGRIGSLARRGLDAQAGGSSRASSASAAQGSASGAEAGRSRSESARRDGATERSAPARRPDDRQEPEGDPQAGKGAR